MSAGFRNLGACDFPSKVHVRKGFTFFRALAPRRSGFGAAISDAVARSSAFCNSICTDRTAMLASRLLGAAAARVIFFFCSRTSKIVFERLHHEVAMLSCQQGFRNLGVCDLSF